MKKIIPIFLLLIITLSSCGVVVVVWSPAETKTMDTKESTMGQTPCREWPDQCEKCRTIPKSGNNKDLRYGVYYDRFEKKCKKIEYSSGSISAPFKSIKECEACCCK